eukprot:m.199960 g.199960  ORF g.199960 m.199960 type:complete len:193 (+) comp16849_c0_seq20:767-1345(+)
MTKLTHGTASPAAFSWTLRIIQLLIWRLCNTMFLFVLLPFLFLTSTQNRHNLFHETHNTLCSWGFRILFVFILNQAFNLLLFFFLKTTFSFSLEFSSSIFVFYQRMFNILKPGGFLINFGPLLYHFEDSRDSASIELSLDEIIQVAENIGFIIKEQQRGLKATYNDDSASMIHTVYECCFFIAQKPPSKPIE